METVELELNDIQGIIRRGYGNLEDAYFILLNITDTSRAKGWLRELADEIRDGTTKPGRKDTCVNIAFTQAGFKELGLVKQFYEDKRFSIEFEDGMTTGHRQNILGDYDESDPKKWHWGGTKPGAKPLHILLLLYAGDEKALEAFYDNHSKKFQGAGLSKILRLGTVLLPDRKEHFGFRDGIAQPTIAGMLDKLDEEKDKVKWTKSQEILDKGGSDGNIVAAGEFILGYKNVYSKNPSSPKVESSSDTGGYLKDDEQGAKDFGCNGSYLVFRQMKQNVLEFWKYIDEKTRNPDGSSNPEARERLAAKMVGRWRSGAPLTLAPDGDKPGLEDADNFGYYPEDRYGNMCPVASHVRRTNPRNSPLERSRLNDKDAKTSLKDANKHRILRRGRSYGEAIAESMDPQDFLNAGETKEKGGLNFICFNANLGRQFEFIQHTWINNPKFSELYSEADPLLGPIPDNANSTQKRIFGKFVAPDEQLRQRVSGLKRFVDVVGGAYFFMPGINAIRYLANLAEPKDEHWEIRGS